MTRPGTRPAPSPPDQPARDRIRRDLDTTLLVEAAAGTGKTASLAARMVALVATGRCGVETLAAVTFTRKAAAELRARFAAELEREARTASGEARARLAGALGRIERCFVGTIHAFCARLLRERPVEAGVDPSFTEADEDVDELLRAASWEAFLAERFAEGDPRLDRLAELGLEAAQLGEAFHAVARYADVEEWPAADPGPGDLAAVRAALAAQLARMAALAPAFPPPGPGRGSDAMMAHWEEILRLAPHRDPAVPAELHELLEPFARATPLRCMRVTLWPGGRAAGNREKEAWEGFARDHARPALARWRERRYAAAIPLLLEAVRVCDAARAARGLLNYQDLLLRAARLLRDRPEVRGYFRGRFTHLLVDEFQDTDPLQAEVALYLTADDDAETDWSRCRPRPGSLFVVGDPKQSIYRFRRADIVTYQRVKEIVLAAGGDVVTLEASFRTLPGLIAWVNDAFAPEVFPARADRYAPAAHPLAPGRADAAGDGEGMLAGVRTLTLGAEAATTAGAADEDARRIARFIRHAVAAGRPVPADPRAGGGTRPARPGDFLIVAWRKERLAVYANALLELGIPHAVSGGSAWGQVPELGLLARALRALVEPENPVALVAVLRGELFGFPDTELHALRAAGGIFHVAAPLPERLAPEVRGRFAEAFGRLARCRAWLHAAPPAAAIERIAAGLGLGLRTFGSPGGDGRAGTIAKAYAVLREAAREASSTTELVAELEALIEGATEFDGLPARAVPEEGVRVMNLHKVKGLEAPVVFLADPGGMPRERALIHVDRAGGAIRGHLEIAERCGEFGRTLLAHPPGWDALAEEEKRFDGAERTRLQYVAATRAGSMLVVSRRTKGDCRNPWKFFNDRLEDAPELPDAPAPPAPAVPAAAADPEAERQAAAAEVDAAEAAIAARWAASGRATYEVRGAKEVAVSAAELRRRAPGDGEHGAAWGTVIHLLLETALREPGRDLAALARAALEEQELPTDLAGAALEAVAAVRASAIWRRAAAAELALVEAPFEIFLDPADPVLARLAHFPLEGGGERGAAPPSPSPLPSREGRAGAHLPLEGGGEGGGGPVPVLLRGVVDLAFRENGRWTIVDWKTDAGAAGRRDALVAKYRGQVELYAELWARIGGEPVAEAGLFFVSSGEYAALPRPA